MKTLTVSATTPPPPVRVTSCEWERGPDPWHKDAFPEDLKWGAPNQEEKRREVWLGVDWCGNVVAIEYDGAVFVENKEGKWRREST